MNLTKSMNMEKCEIKYFGMIAEKLGKESEEIDLQELIGRYSNVKDSILLLNPELKGMTFSVAVNDKLKESWSEHEKILSVSVLPPFAGG